MVLIPFTINPWEQFGPMLQAFLTTNHHPRQRNPGAPHTPTLNITTPTQTSCTNKPPSHHAHLVSSHQLTYIGVNPLHQYAKHSLITLTLHPHQVYIHFNFNSLDSAFQKHLACYYAMLPVRSNFFPPPLYLTYTHSSLWKIHTL
jgi:hypothetical protein